MSTSDPSKKPKKVAIIGAGPVGALAGLYFSHAGWSVTIYELRGGRPISHSRLCPTLLTRVDLRLPENRTLGSGKSINLALSERGINGLRNIGDSGALLEKVLEETIPMHGRMIHSGKVGEAGEAQAYDSVQGRFIRSADRALLNMQLLDSLEQRDDVRLCFNHRLHRLKLDGEKGAEAELSRRFVASI